MEVYIDSNTLRMRDLPKLNLARNSMTMPKNMTRSIYSWLGGQK